MKFISLLPSQRPSFLIAVVAVGSDEVRGNITRANVERMYKNLETYDKYRIECVVYTYSFKGQELSWITQLQNVRPQEGFHCDVVQQPGYEYLNFLSMLQPWLLQERYDYLMLLLDDINTSALDYTELFESTVANSLSMSSPAVRRAYHRSTVP
ncbi:MAG: hypothetical protein AAF242_19025, partial [Bacteroidota bacterium]